MELELLRYIQSAASPVLDVFFIGITMLAEPALWVVVLAVLIGAVFITLILLSNKFFIRSILDPVLDITATAKRIAAGSPVPSESPASAPSTRIQPPAIPSPAVTAR